MPHFTQHLGTEGPIIKLLLTVSDERRNALDKAGVPIPQGQLANGLLDTGASGTCVDPSVIKALGLVSTGETSMLTPSTKDGPVPADEYDCGIIIYGPTTENPYVIRNLSVTEAPLLEKQGFHALIGRDVLSKCVFIYDGATKIYTLAF